MNYQPFEVCEACLKGVIHPVITDASKDDNDEDFLWGFYGACKGGHLDIVNLMIDRVDLHLNHGLEIVCETGRRDMVDFFINKGNVDISWGLCGACRGGHLDLVHLMIEKGARATGYWSLEEACFGGNMDVVKFLIDHGNDDWDTGLVGACEGGHQSIVELMIQKGARDWNNGLYFALNGSSDFFNDTFKKVGHHKKQLLTAKMMIERGANNFNNIKTKDLVLLLNVGLSERYFKNYSRLKRIIKKRKDAITYVSTYLDGFLHQDVIRFVVVPTIQYNTILKLK
jgi:ankyrin repeat protein